VATDPAATPNRWRGVPLDERQAERRRILVDVGFELLGTVGVAGATVRGVCEAAHLNPRYFYESFEDLDALLVAVFDRTAADGLAVILEAAAAAGDEDALVLTRGVIGAFLHHLTDDPRRAQVLYIAGLGNEALNRRRLRAMADMAALFVRGRRDEARRRGGPEDAVDPVHLLAASVIVGGMSELVMTWLDGRTDVGLDQVIDDAAVLFVSLGDAAAAVADARSPATRR
jgi:AcrR family transcriptional regulator